MYDDSSHREEFDTWEFDCQELPVWARNWIAIVANQSRAPFESPDRY